MVVIQDKSVMGHLLSIFGLMNQIANNVINRSYFDRISVILSNSTKISIVQHSTMPQDVNYLRLRVRVTYEFAVTQK